MPSGRVTRSTFLGSPSGSIKTAATTGMPDSTRPSLPVKQTCLALASWPLRQNLVQGEKMSCGCSPAGGCCSEVGAGAGAGAFGAALPFGAAFGAGACADAVDAATNVSIAVASTTASALATGRTGANTMRVFIVGPLTDRSHSARAGSNGRPRISCVDIKYGKSVTPCARVIAESRLLIKHKEQGW